jgi:hypothetical protein
MSPSDSQRNSPGGYVFPPAPWVELPPPRPVGSPRFLSRSVPARRLLPPRKVRRVLLPVASPSMSGFTALRRAGHLRLPNEAEMSSLTLRLTSSPLQGFARKVAPPRACRATCRAGNLQGELLSVHKISQACPGATEVVQKAHNFAIPRKLDSQLHWAAVRSIFWVGGKWIMEIAGKNGA